MLLLSDLLTHSGEKEVQYINSHYLHRIRKNYLYGLFIQTICNNLLRGDEEHLNIFLDSFIKSGLADDTRVIASDKQDVFLLTLPDGRKIKFSNVPLPKDLIDEYRGNCHAVISSWMRLYKKDHNVSVVLEPNPIYGNFYHSFVVENGDIIDLSHNIMMRYEDYLQLVKPKVLVYEDSRVLLNKMQKLEDNDVAFRECDYVDILKYGMNQQLIKKRKKIKKESILQLEYLLSFLLEYQYLNILIV